MSNSGKRRTNDELKEAAKALGYEFILWNGKVYRACGVGTLYTEEDIQ